MIYPIQLISMALFASNGEDPINAWDASPEKPYWCLACKAPLRLRKGLFRFPHFSHLSSTPSCRLYSKSKRHFLAQLALQKKLPLGEALLEIHFPSIRRIADVCWEKKKIVFEIQCSPISEQEVKERIEEYNSLGYEVVWILDERRFNKKRLSKAENFLRTRSLSYFLEKGNSFTVYDQLETLHLSQRLKKGGKTAIDVSKIKTSIQIDATKPLPKNLKKRIQLCKYFFENDWISRSEKNDFTQAIERWLLQENALLNSQPTDNQHLIKIFYRKLLNMLLKFNQ